MTVVPDKINRDWIQALSDADLVEAEASVHATFASLERREKKLRGYRYELMRGPADLMLAWDRWSRLNAAARERSLKTVRPDK